MPTGSELQTPSALMTPPHGRMLAPVSWLLGQVAVGSSAKNEVAGSIQEALHSFSGICRMSLEELLYPLHTGSSLSCLLHGFPEVSLPAKAGITSPLSVYTPAPFDSLHQQIVSSVPAGTSVPHSPQQRPEDW